MYWIVSFTLSTNGLSFLTKNGYSSLVFPLWQIPCIFPVTLPTKRCRVDQVGSLHFKAV